MRWTLNVRILIPFLLAATVQAAGFPEAEITNGQIRVKVYLPDASQGFYRGTRFDWSGMLASLEYRGHVFYGAWFQKTDPTVHDFAYEGAEIVAGPCTAATGPAEEFLTGNEALGYDEAKPGGTFLKIGVGVLRRPDAGKYDRFRLYDIANPGKWSIHSSRSSVEFTQRVSDPSSGYGYEYRKIVRLVSGKPEMVLEHSIRNTGRRPIQTRVYNHNFLTLDHQSPGPDFVITVPFQIRSDRPPDGALAEIRGNRIVYLKTLVGRDRVATPMPGFGSGPADYDIRIQDSKSGAGVRMTSDRPMVNLALWSIRTVLAAEPFIGMTIPPGEAFDWRITYQYH